MNVIRFEIEGILNSFRIPAFKAYHRTFLAPPKSTVIGMLCNVSLKSQKEFFEILEKDLIKVSVIIKEIKGKTKDLWSYKTFGKKNRGKNIIRRDKLFLPEYVVYLNIKNNNLFNEILNALKNPKNVPSLGLDDEIVTIKNVKAINIEENDTNIIDSVFKNERLNYRTYIKDKIKPVYPPVSNNCAVKFKAFNKKGKFISREVIENMMQVEFINCEIEFNENIKSYKDRELNYKMVFY
jgi:CRISPR-associated protein Cas5t